MLSVQERSGGPWRAKVRGGDAALGHGWPTQRQ
jgi:hypothetical protein